MSIPPSREQTVNPLKTAPRINGPIIHPAISQIVVAAAIATGLSVLGTKNNI